MGNQYRLHRRKSGFYYHRVKVPSDIRKLYGKQIEQKSLDTCDLREAVRRLPAVIVHTDMAFSRFREEHAEALGNLIMDTSANLVAMLDVRRLAADYGKKIEAEEFVRRAETFKTATADFRAFRFGLSLPDKYDEFLDHWDGLGDVAPILGLVHRVHIEERLTALRKARATGDFERWETAADSLAHGIDSVDRVALIKALMQEEIRVLEDWQDVPEFTEHPKPSPDVKAAAVEVVVPSYNGKISLPIMSKLHEECFAAIGKEKKWSAKTETARFSQIKLFLEICGDKPLNEYTQADIRAFKQVLIDLPSNSHSRPEFKGLSKPDAAKKAVELGISGLSIESIRQNMTAVSMVYGWSRGHYDMNLVNFVVSLIPPPPSTAEKRDKRDELDTQDLNKLFQQPVFTGVKSKAEWYEAGHVSMADNGRFWIPLLGLFSGARLMEGVQLLQSDIGCENGIWFIDINDDDDGGDKTVKNYASKRRIPIHPELVRLGFLKLVEATPRGTRLFPDIEIGPPAQRSRAASKMFNKLLEVAGVKSKKKVWHSLRHSFEQACRDSRVDSAIMDQLQGHTQQGMRKSYGREYPLEALRDGVNSISYKGLDLSHVAPFSV